MRGLGVTYRLRHTRLRSCDASGGPQKIIVVEGGAPSLKTENPQLASRSRWLSERLRILSERSFGPGQGVLAVVLPL